MNRRIRRSIAAEGVNHEETRPQGRIRRARRSRPPSTRPLSPDEVISGTPLPRTPAGSKWGPRAQSCGRGVRGRHSRPCGMRHVRERARVPGGMIRLWSSLTRPRAFVRRARCCDLSSPTMSTAGSGAGRTPTSFGCSAASLTSRNRSRCPSKRRWFGTSTSAPTAARCTGRWSSRVSWALPPVLGHGGGFTRLTGA